MSIESQQQTAHLQLVQQIYAAATAICIADKSGPSFEEVLDQSIQAARVYADRITAGQPNLDDWLRALPGMK